MPSVGLEPTPNTGLSRAPLPDWVKRANLKFLKLVDLGSNQDSSVPETDVLPITLSTITHPAWRGAESSGLEPHAGVTLRPLVSTEVPAPARFALQKLSPLPRKAEESNPQLSPELFSRQPAHLAHSPSPHLWQELNPQPLAS